MLPRNSATPFTASFTRRLRAVLVAGTSPASAAAAITVPFQVLKSLAEKSSPVAAFT